MKKADKTYVNDELMKKADKTYVNDELMKKADKEHTHYFFSTVAIENIEGTVDGTDGDALYYIPPNFPQGLTSNENITTNKKIKCKNVYVMSSENNVKFTVQDLYDKKADKTYVNDELEKKADKTYVNEIYQSLIGTTKNIETIVGDFSVNEENKYFRWQLVQSLKMVHGVNSFRKIHE
ncbi:hypothetical protein TVAG_571580, partial [Trichomonas vaginalis G3]